MDNKEEKQLIQLINKLRNEYCEYYNCCFDKDKGYCYDELDILPRINSWDSRMRTRTAHLTMVLRFLS